MKTMILATLLLLSTLANATVDKLSHRDLSSLKAHLENAVYAEAFGNCGIIETTRVNPDKIFSTVVSFMGEEYLEGIELNIDNTAIYKILKRMTEESFYKDTDNSELRNKILKLAKRIDVNFFGLTLSGESFGSYSSNHQLLAIYDQENQELLFYAEGNCE